MISIHFIIKSAIWIIHTFIHKFLTIPQVAKDLQEVGLGKLETYNSAGNNIKVINNYKKMCFYFWHILVNTIFAQP